MGLKVVNLYQSIRATTISYGLRFVLQLLQIMVLARLLQPSDFGLLAVIGSLLITMDILADIGIGRALIHFRDVSDNARSSLYWISLAIAICIALAVAGAAPLAAILFKEPMLASLLAINALVFPLSALGRQFLVFAEKELRFSVLARIEIASTLIGVTASIFLAMKGWGAYSVVVGSLASTGMNTFLAWLYLSDGWRPAWRLNLEEVRPMLKFGAYIVGESIATTLHREADMFIGGAVIGSGPLGFYAIARNLALKLAMTVINPVVTRAGFPVMAHMQHDRPQLKATYLSMLRMVSSVNFPLYLMIALFAGEIIALLYGPQWGKATYYLEILAVWGLIRSIGNPVGNLVVAVGRAKLAFWWNSALLVVTPLILLIGTIFCELNGLVWSLLLLHLLIFVAMWKLMVFPLCGATFSEYLHELSPPLLISVASVAPAWLVVQLIENPLPRLTMGGILFILGYILLSYKYNRPWYNAMRKLLISR
jgi:O-antigen/teichoic acid export membrane protein